MDLYQKNLPKTTISGNNPLQQLGIKVEDNPWIKILEN